MKKNYPFFISVFFITLLFNTSQAQENKGKISGYMFGDYFYNIARDTGILNLPDVANGGVKGMNGFQFRRIYFTYDYRISEKFSSRFRLESQITANQNILVFIKDAWLKWNYSGSHEIYFGISPTPTYTVSEDIWGHRYLEKTIADLRGISPSRDFGISFSGNILEGGQLKYFIMYANGFGSKPENNKQKRLFGHILFNPGGNWYMTLYADFHGAPRIADERYPSASSTLANHTFTPGLFAGYRKEAKFSLGIEGFMPVQKNILFNEDELTYSDQTTLAVSVFGSVNLTEHLSTVGRYDYFDPSKESGSDLRNLALFGLTWQQDEKIYITPNICIEAYENLPGGIKAHPSVTGRLTIFYNF